MASSFYWPVAVRGTIKKAKMELLQCRICLPQCTHSDYFQTFNWAGFKIIKTTIKQLQTPELHLPSPCKQ